MALPTLNSDPVYVKKAIKLQNNAREHYQMTSEVRGICLIINNENFSDKEKLPRRHGSTYEAQRLESVFKQLNFKVNRISDATIAVIESTVDEIKNDVGLNRHNAFVAIVLSHGDSGGVYGYDGKRMKIHQLINCFNNTNCLALINKPKIFLINACRGGIVPEIIKPNILSANSGQQNGDDCESVISDDDDDEKVLNEKAVKAKKENSVWSDMILCYSTVRGYVSMRDKNDGSFFGKELIDVITTQAYTLDIESIFRKVSDLVSRRRGKIKKDSKVLKAIQTPDIKLIGWSKKLYFNPSLYAIRELNGYAVRIFDINTTESGDKYRLYSDRLEEVLKKTNGLPIALITIVGEFKTGKSFLLSYMMRYLNNTFNINWIGSLEKNKGLDGFIWDSGMDPQTMGIEIWSEPFIFKLYEEKEIAVVLMDTQGLFDEVTDFNDSATIVGLSLVTSSTIIFNVPVDLKDNTLMDLDCFMDYGIEATNACYSNKMEPNEPFQRLVFLVRDWEKTSYPPGSDSGKQFIDEKLAVKENTAPTKKKIRERLTSKFTNIDGFLMPPPGSAAKEDHFDGRLSPLDPIFVEYLKSFILQLCSPETINVKKIDTNLILAEKLLEIFTKSVEAFNLKNSSNKIKF